MERFDHISLSSPRRTSPGTTALRALRAAFPAPITLLTNNLMKDVCPPGVFYDEAIYTKDRAPAWKGFLSSLGEVRKIKIDLAVNLRWSSEGSAYMTLLSGAKARSGSGPRGSRWIYNIRAPLFEGRRHEFLRHLDIARACGAPESVPEPYVHVEEADRRFAAEALARVAGNAGSLIVFHPGASTASKAWPASYFVELGKLFVRTFDLPVLVTRGPGEDALAGEVTAGIGARAHLAPSTTIGGLAALIGSCSMCVCNYSGVMNVAMAVKTPLLALGCTSPEDWGPYGDLHHVLPRGRWVQRGERAAASLDNVWKTSGTRPGALARVFFTSGDRLIIYFHLAASARRGGSRCRCLHLSALQRDVIYLVIPLLDSASS
jgi:ADP-heptose:LPS heptosyltransferase